MLKALNLITLIYTMTWPFAALGYGIFLPKRASDLHECFKKFLIFTASLAGINALLYILVVLANNPDKYFN